MCIAFAAAQSAKGARARKRHRRRSLTWAMTVGLQVASCCYNAAVVACVGLVGRNTKLERNSLPRPSKWGPMQGRLAARQPLCACMHAYNCAAWRPNVSDEHKAAARQQQLWIDRTKDRRGDNYVCMSCGDGQKLAKSGHLRGGRGGRLRGRDCRVGFAGDERVCSGCGVQGAGRS